MNDLTKLGLGAAAIGAATYMGYEGITYFLNPAGGATKLCSNQQTVCFNKWLSAMQSFMVEDSKNGTAITVEQQSVLNEYVACMNNAQANCVAAYKSLNVSTTGILQEIGGIIASGIAAAIIIYGLGKALAQNKSKPPQKGTKMTWEEAIAYLLPLMIQTNVNEGKISRTFAESFQTYAPDTLSPILTQNASSQIAYFQEQAIITEVELAALTTEAAAAIAFDVELSAAIIVLA